jgi:hypothetical protein
MRGVTKHQMEMLGHIRTGGPDGDLDFDQLLDKLSWVPSKESAQFTIRAAVVKGFIMKLPELQLRRGRNRVCYRLTKEGGSVLDPRGYTPSPEVKSGVPGFECSGSLDLDVSSDF